MMYATKTGNRYLFASIFSFILMSTLISYYSVVTETEIGVVQSILLSQWGMVFLSIVIYFVVTKQPIIKTALYRKIKPLNVLFSLLLGGLILPTLSLINVISQFFVKSYISSAVMELAKLPLWLGILLIAVTPALLEELAMRSIIINNYRSKTVLITCLISGFFFGMFHMNLNQFFYAFAMGILMCLAVHLTGSIFSSMIIHFVVNLIGILGAKVVDLLVKFYENTNPELAKQFADQMTAVPTPGQLLTSTLLLVAINLVTIPLIGLVLYGMMRYNNKMNIFKDKLTTDQVLGLSEPTIQSEDPGMFSTQASSLDFNASQRIFTPFLIAAISLFVAFVFTNEILMPLVLS